MSSQVKNPVSDNYETKKHQHFSIVSLPTDSILVEHAVQGDSSFTARTINLIKKLVKIMKRWAYIPFI
jgi:hypothetical protein